MLFTHKYKHLLREQHGDPMSDFIFATVHTHARLLNTPEKNKIKIRQYINYFKN